MKKNRTDSYTALAPFPGRNDPHSLLNLFTLLSLASVALILIMAGYGGYHIYSREFIKGAEEDAIAVGRAIFVQEREALVSRDAGGSERIAVAPAAFGALDARMREFLRPLHTSKIKVFSSDKTVVYSTDPTVVGKVDSGNWKLDRVLKFGEVLSNLENKDKVLDLVGEQRFDVDVVETYLPIVAGNAIIGSFEVYVDVTHTLGRITKVLALSVSQLFAALSLVFVPLYVLMRRGMLQLKRAQDDLHRLASVDALTGLLNRGPLMARSHEEYSRIHRGRAASRAKGCISFIMADLDHFKHINDYHGHLVGDEVLRCVAAVLMRLTRDYDVVGRYGGEEFLIALPGSDLEDARRAAARMRRAIEQTSIVLGTQSIRVTMSFGVSSSVPGDADELAAIERADQALYTAKSEGRNRVAVM